MKTKTVVMMFALICLTSFSFAGQMTQEMGDQQGDMMSKGMMMDMKKGMGDHMTGDSMMYSMMVHHILMKASALDLTDTQTKNWRIKEKYLYPIVRKGADFKISQMRIMDMLHDPGFDPAKFKSEIKTSNQINLEMADMMADALTAIRKAVGPENFKQVMKMMPMDCGMMKGGEMMENEPAQEKEDDSSSDHDGHHQDQ
jgi:hypothetical protein